MDHIPKWIANLTDEDMSFIKNFVLSSGSLKEMSQMYQVSYPTMSIALAICALVFFIARSLIRYAHSLKKNDKSSKQSAEDKRIALQDL